MAFLPCKFFFVAFIIPYFVLSDASTVPELKYHPRLPSTYGASFIWYYASDQANVSAMTQNLDQFLEGYRTPGVIPGRGQSLVNCDYSHPPKDGEICDVNVRDWSQCTTENHYSYHRRSPCIFLSLDKMVGWKPEFYNDSSLLPADMPDYLKNHIAELKMQDPRKANQVWVSCSGENPVDVENIGPLQFFPGHGFPGYFFPYSDTEGNLSPLVAVHFERPLAGIVISVECKLWARNLKNSPPEKQGVLHFELLID